NRLWAARRAAWFGDPIGVTKGDGARSEPPALCGLHDDVAVRAAAHAALVADADDLRQHAHRPVGVLGDDDVGGVMAERVSGLRAGPRLAELIEAVGDAEAEVGGVEHEVVGEHLVEAGPLALVDE